MSSAQKIIATAEKLGYTVNRQDDEIQSTIIARNAAGNVAISATYVGSRFDSGYTVDRGGYCYHHRTVKELIQFATVA